MRIAFKEWAIVVDALGRGEQIVILRKGGISEGKGGFKVAEREFFLFPTLYHQQRQSIIPWAQERFDAAAPEWPGAEVVRIEYFARVEQWWKLETLEQARRLRGQHIWKDEVIAERFEWGPGKGIFALAARVFRLRASRELPMDDSYGGCKSWVELKDEIDVGGATPVLSDSMFLEKMSLIQQAVATEGNAETLS